jgi:cytochrome P450
VFAPPAVRESLPVIESAVCALIERIPRGQPFDFMAAFANPLPRTVMCAFMGFPAGSESALREAFTTIEVTRSNARAGPPMVALAEAARDNAARALASFAPEDVPTTSVLGALMAAAARGNGLDTDRVTSVAAHIATVGADPTTGALANSLAAIAARPDLAARLRVEPALLRPAAHELLRYDSPTHIVARFAAEDSELSGRRIRRGDAVLAVVGAANRDPAVFPEPDTLDFARDARRQLAFGQGEHICLGAPLALAILEVAVRELVCAFGSIELVEPARYSGSIELRVPDRLMLRCN